MIILFSDAAVADLFRLRSFLTEKNPIAGSKAAARLLSAINSLQQFPSRGRQASRLDLRELIVPFGRSAYIVRYRYRSEAKEVTILRVWHAREARD